MIDPAGGSWFVESLTDELARAAWAFFQEIEAAGGVVAALDSGLVAARTAAVRAARETRRRHPPRRRSPASASSPTCTRSRSQRPDLLAGRAAPGGLPVYRPAAAFEAFRDRSDARLAATGARPRAFLATLGPLAAHAARAAFTRNLLHAGGIDTVDAGPTEGVDDVVAAFRGAGTPVAVLCSTDALYAERAERRRRRPARRGRAARPARGQGPGGRASTGTSPRAATPSPCSTGVRRTRPGGGRA